MNREISQVAALLALLAVGLLAAVGWSYFTRVNLRERFASERQDLDRCNAIANKILELRQRKQRALLQTKPTGELNRKIDNWASLAGIPSAHIVGIQPREPRRIGDSQYLEQVTELEVYQTPLAKLLKFSQIAEQNGEGLKLASLRLSPPRSGMNEDGQPEVWNAEMALTYLIYSPKSG